MGVGSGGCRRPSSDDDRSSRHRKNHARLAHSRHYESAQRIGTTGSRLDPLPMRHIAQLWHQRCSAIRSTAPYRIHRILGRRRRGIGSTRRDHAGASGHPIHGRGARILGTHPANLARTIGIRVCGDIPRERHHLLSGTIPTDHAANPCPCGYAYGNGERCTCREKDRIKYFSRLSGPILDRIDIQIEVLLWNASTQARFLPANPATPSACGSWWQGKRHRNVSGNSDGSAMRKPPEHGFAPTRPQKPSSS